MPGDGVRVGRAVIRLLAGIPLRMRLLAAACCLVAVGAATIGLVATSATKGDLMRQADRELRSYAGLLASRPFTATPAGPVPDRVGSAYVIEVMSGGLLVMRTSQDPRPGPAVAALTASTNQPAIVPAGGGGSWLVVAEAVHYSAQRILFTYGSDDFSLHVTSTARPGTAGTLAVGLDVSSVAGSVRNTADRCAVLGCAAVLAVAVLGLALLRVVRRPPTPPEETAGDVITLGL